MSSEDFAKLFKEIKGLKDLEKLRAEERKKQQAQLDSIQAKQNTISIQFDAIYQRIEDISKKTDLFWNAGIKQPAQPKAPSKKTTTTSTGKKDNIMTYFKTKYVANPNYFDDILDSGKCQTKAKPRQ